jgi:ophiobolin F synthase
VDTDLKINVKYAQQKGFAEDVSEGKMSLPMIHALSIRPDTTRSRSRLLSILQQRKLGDGLSLEVQKLVQDEIKACGALERTRLTVRELLAKMDTELIKCERETGLKNWTLRLIQKRLEV